MFHLNRKSGKISYDETKYLPEFQILYPFIDKDNRVWFGTTKGVLQQELRPPLIHSYYYPSTDEGPRPEVFQRYINTKTCCMLVGSPVIKGLAIIDARTMKLIREVNFFGNDSDWNEVRTIEMYHPDAL
jgi:hypothetical protein